MISNGLEFFLKGQKMQCFSQQNAFSSCGCRRYSLRIDMAKAALCIICTIEIFWVEEVVDIWKEIELFWIYTVCVPELSPVWCASLEGFLSKVQRRFL